MTATAARSRFRALVEDAAGRRVVETDEPVWEACMPAFLRFIGAPPGARVEFHDPEFGAWVALRSPADLTVCFAGGCLRPVLRLCCAAGTTETETERLRRTAMDDVERWARRAVPGSRRVAPWVLDLGTVEGSAARAHAAAHEDGICVRLLGLLCERLDPNPAARTRALEWALAANASLQVGSFALVGDGIGFAVPLLRRFVSSDTPATRLALEPHSARALKSGLGALRSALAHARAAVLVRPVKAPRPRPRPKAKPATPRCAPGWRPKTVAGGSGR